VPAEPELPAEPVSSEPPPPAAADLERMVGSLSDAEVDGLLRLLDGPGDGTADGRTVTE
jgi:hypothetical protein